MRCEVSLIAHTRRMLRSENQSRGGLSGLDRNHCLVASSQQTFFHLFLPLLPPRLDTALVTSLYCFFISKYFLTKTPFLESGDESRDTFSKWKNLEKSFEGHPFTVHLGIKCRSPFHPLFSRPALSQFSFSRNGRKSCRARLYHYSRWRASMKLDPFQPILRPHGFLRPLHYYSFSFSPKHLPSLNTPPLSKQVAVLLPLSLSLYTDTNKRIFVFDSSPAGGECESSRAERFAVHSTLLALRMGTMGARGKRGPPFWHDSQKEAERGERRRDRGRLCRADRQLSFSFLSRISLIISGREGGALDEFFESFVKSFFSCTTRRNIVLKDWTMRSRGWKGVEIGYIFRRNNYFLP